MPTCIRHILFRLLPVVLAGGFLLGICLSFPPPAPLSWGVLFFSIGIATPFCVVGSLVWYFGDQRRPARLFCAHCATVVLCCACFPGTTPLLNDLALLLAVGSMALLFHFLWFLPQSYLALLREDAPRRYVAWIIVHAVVDLGSVVGGGGVLLLLTIPGWHPLLELWLSLFALLDLGVGCGWSLVAYRGTEQPREREQLRLVWLGTVLAVLPPLGLLALPRLLHWSIVSPWLALLSLPIFPLALGYAVLRYQLLLPDRVVSRVALWLLRGLLFPLLIALVVGVAFTLFPTSSPDLAVFLAVSMTVLGPALWWGTGVVIPFLFAQDTPSLAAFLSAPPPVASVEEAMSLLSSALSLASRSSQVCLCLCLDGQQVCLPIPTARQQTRKLLLQRAHALWGADWSDQQPFFLLPESVRLSLHTQAWLSLQQWQAHVSVSRSSRLPRVFSWGLSEAQADVLALPVRLPATDRFLGLLILGPAEDGQPYAGADLERVMQVVETAAPWLAQAQRQEHADRQDRFLDQLYRGLALLPTSHSAEEVVRAYAELIVSLGASVEAIWLDVSEGESWLRMGTGPWLAPEEKRALLAAEVERPHFRSSGEGAWSCAVVRLPLAVTFSPLVLLVTYPHPYIFLPRERAYWQVLAQHCQDRLEALALLGQRADAWPEQTTLLTVLAGNMDLVSQGEMAEAQAYLATRRAAEAAQRLVETSTRCTHPPCPDPAVCVPRSSARNRKRA